MTSTTGANDNANLPRLEPKTGKVTGGALQRMQSLRGLLALAAVLLIWIAYPPHMGSGTEGPAMMPWQYTQLRAILLETSVTGLLAVGMTLVIIGGGIDLSVGSLLGMTGICFATFTLKNGWSPETAILLTVAVGAAAGLMNGLWVVNLRFGLPLLALVGFPVVGTFVGLAEGWTILVAAALGLGAGVVLYLIHRYFGMSRTMQPFAATLAMMVIARGGAKLFSGGAKVQSVTGKSPEFYRWLTTGTLPPLVFVFLGAVVVAWVLLKYTRFGRHVYAVGGNSESARLSGVRVKLVTAMTYVICGVTAALAGMGQVTKLRIGDPEEGMGYELDAIAAVVLGGTSLMGGRGGVLLTLLGVLIIGFLEKYLSLHGWETWARLMAKGAIIVFAVAMQRQAK